MQKQRATQHQNGHNIKRAFTIIELIVVVSIIIILIALLMPTLSSAREQAKIATCLSNMKQIGSGVYSYLQSNEMFPIGPAERMSFNEQDENGVRITRNYTTCHWGGKRCLYLHKTTENEEEEKQYRPLTRFMYKNYHWNKNFNPETDRKQVVEFPLFMCPSDKYIDTAMILLGMDDAPKIPIYEICGNSYYLNMHGEMHVSGSEPNISPSKVIFSHEAPLYSYFEGITYGLGWHGKEKKHNVLFLDSHAAYMEIDSRERKGGEWSASDFLSCWWYYE